MSKQANQKALEEIKTFSSAGQLSQAQMMQKKFEFENEVIEEELY